MRWSWILAVLLHLYTFTYLDLILGGILIFLMTRYKNFPFQIQVMTKSTQRQVFVFLKIFDCLACWIKANTLGLWKCLTLFFQEKSNNLAEKQKTLQSLKMYRNKLQPSCSMWPIYLHCPAVSCSHRTGPPGLLMGPHLSVVPRYGAHCST